MRKEQFDILVALEKDRLPHTAQELAALTGHDAATLLEELTAQYSKKQALFEQREGYSIDVKINMISHARVSV